MHVRLGCTLYSRACSVSYIMDHFPVSLDSLCVPLPDLEEALLHCLLAQCTLQRPSLLEQPEHELHQARVDILGALRLLPPLLLTSPLGPHHCNGNGCTETRIVLHSLGRDKIYR